MTVQIPGSSNAARNSGGHMWLQQSYDQNFTRPENIEGALQRGLAEVRGGRPAVIAVRLARLMGED